VLDVLPRYLAKDGVVAVGEVGYDSMTKAEDDAFARQLDLAIEHGLPALVHTPRRDKLAGTRRTLQVVGESGILPERVAVDHLNEVTVELVKESGCWMGFSIYPDTKMDETRMVTILQEYGTDKVLVNPVGFILDFPNGSTTWTARTRRSGSTAATAGSARTWRGRTRAAAGTLSRPATVTCRGRSRSAR
jgi:hypothetical protein